MKTQKYLLGWVTGTLHPTGGEMLNEGPPRQRRSVDNAVSCMIREAIIYPSRAAAERAAQPPCPFGWPRFVRGYAYETPNPENAKGLPLISSLPAGSLGPFPVA